MLWAIQPTLLSINSLSFHSGSTSKDTRTAEANVISIWVVSVKSCSCEIGLPIWNGNPFHDSHSILCVMVDQLTHCTRPNSQSYSTNRLPVSGWEVGWRWENKSFRSQSCCNLRRCHGAEHSCLNRFRKIGKKRKFMLLTYNLGKLKVAAWSAVFSWRMKSPWWTIHFNSCPQTQRSTWHF